MKRKTAQLFFLIPFLLILTISLFVLYHARIISPLYEKHYIKQGLFFTTGLLLLCFRKKIPTKWLFDYSFYLYLANLLLLVIVLFFGSNANGAKAWFDLGLFSFQPSELMKLSLCLYLSHITMNKMIKTKKDQRTYLCTVFFITLLPSILVFLEPDTGAIIFYFLILLAIIGVSSISKKWMGILFLFILSLLALFFYAYYHYQHILIKFIGTSFFYRVERLLNFGTGLQINNALTAIGSSPFFRWNLNESIIYIPEAPTDFIFAFTATTFGIFGLLIILLSYFFLDIYILNLWKKKRKTKDIYFLSGFLVMFVFNQLQNIFMNIGLSPIIGIPLPFFSYGGSSTIVYFLFLTLILKKEKN